MQPPSGSTPKDTSPAHPCLPDLRLRSAAAQHCFPALPDAPTAHLLAVLQQLEQSQWWSPERLRAHQFRQRDAVLAFAHGSIPFYRKRLDAAGIAPRGGVSPEAWARLPVLTRAEVQKHVQELLAKKPPPGHRQLGQAQTSGSTGTPIRVATSETTRLLWQAFVLREHYWHGRDFNATLAVIRHFGEGVQAAWPEGMALEDWGVPVNLLHASGPGMALDIHTDPREQLQWLARVRPAYLLTFPSNAAALAQLSLAEGRPLPGLRQVRLVSEAVDAELRTLLHQAWGAPVVDTYSAQEAGVLALQCPEHEHYHVQCENVLLEVVDEQGQPCAPGQTGRVLITTLHNFAMPLIRYELGDYAEVGPVCDCGRGLPVLRRILGRVRNMLALPDGARRWPNLSATFYRDIAPVIQHQLVQHDLQNIEVRLVTERALSTDEEQALSELIVRRLGHPFALRFSYPERIERSAAGKFEEFVSRIEPASQPTAGATPG